MRYPGYHTGTGRSLDTQLVIAARGRSTAAHGAGGQNGPHSPATRRCQPIRSPSPPTLPSGLPMAPPLPPCATIRAAIRAGHVDTDADDPTGHDGVRRVLQGLTRQAAGRGRGQADPLTADDCAAILRNGQPAQAHRARHGIGSGRSRPGRHRPGDCRRAVPGWLAPVGSGGASLGRRAGRGDGRGIVVYVRRSKTDQDGTAADVRYLKNGCAVALRQLRDRITVWRSGLRPDGNRPGVRRHQRPVHSTAPHGSGQRRRYQGANHRALRARRPCRRIDQARRTGAGYGESGRVEVVTDGRPTTAPPSQPSRAPSLPTCSGQGGAADTLRGRSSTPRQQRARLRGRVATPHTFQSDRRPAHNVAQVGAG